MKTLRDYQEKLAKKALDVLKKYGIVYLAMEVRTGKTATALQVAKLFGAKKLIFITKKKAIKSIKDDHKEFGFDKHFELVVINNESLHKIPDKNFDLLISDEHHRAGAYPKTTKIAKDIKKRFGHLPIIALSGTPHPESYSQIYHQFWVKKVFWKKHVNTFYKWFKIYGLPKQRHLGYAVVNDYSTLNQKGEQLIKELRRALFVTYTQEKAGFKTDINKKVVNIPEYDYIRKLSRQIIKDKFIEIDGMYITADTAVKLQNKVHQIENGSVITDCGNRLILSDFKARQIKELFKSKKLAIFYYYKAELEILQNVFGDSLTNDLEEFKTTDKHIALQQVSGSEGISLKEADVLVYYNFGFSNVKYTQGIDRLTTMDRLSNDVYFVFSKSSINSKIYDALQNKKSYITSAFKQDYRL